MALSSLSIYSIQLFRTRQASATTSAFSLICPSSVTSRSWFEISISITNINTINDIATFMYCCFHQRLTITKVGPDKELVCAVRAVLAARRFLINMINIWGHGVRPAKSFRRLYFSFSVQCSCIFSTRTARYNWFLENNIWQGKQCCKSRPRPEDQVIITTQITNNVAKAGLVLNSYQY